MASARERPEASNPLLDAWLASHCCLAWIDALREIEACEAGTTLSQLEARAELEALDEGATDDAWRHDAT